MGYLIVMHGHPTPKADRDTALATEALLLNAIPLTLVVFWAAKQRYTTVLKITQVFQVFGVLTS